MSHPSLVISNRLALGSYLATGLGSVIAAWISGAGALACCGVIETGHLVIGRNPNVIRRQMRG